MHVKNEAPKLEPQGSTLPELVKELREWTDKKKALDAEVEVAKSMIHKIAVLRLPSLMDKLGQDDFNAPGYGRVELNNEVYAHVNKEHEDAFFEFLREQGEGDLIKESVHHKTLNGWAEGVLGDPERAALLPDYVNITEIPTAKLLKERARRK